MKISVDATNIKAGGGLTHLSNIVESYSGADNISIIGGEWIKKIDAKDTIVLDIYKDAFSSIYKQEFFKRYKLHTLLENSDISFIPGGTFFSKKVKYVSMSQNMLVFENEERNRFPWTKRLRYLLLEKLQVKSFRNAAGVIYISKYAKKYIEDKYPDLKEKKSTVIYHGISENFRQLPKKQKPIASYDDNNPFEITYISIINFYKHQWNVIDAIKKLKSEGYAIKLNLIGDINTAVKERFEKSLIGTEGYVTYLGKVPYEKIQYSYKSSDMFVFASTCENMPNILVEAMTAGLPIVCSNYGPMPEILNDAGLYIDPLSVNNIYENIKKLLINEDLRSNIASKAYEYSKNYSWEKTSQLTFDFIKSLQ